MATRLYFGLDSPLISPAPDAAWDVTGSLVRRLLEGEKHGPPTALESLAASTTSNSPAGAVDVLNAQYISAPLSGNQTISGAIKGQIRAFESNAAANARVQLVVRVLSGDGTTVRGTLIAASAAALSNEFNTALRNIKIPLGGSTVPTSVNALDGDRIVVEIGWRKHESATTNRAVTLSSGNPTGTDLAEDETTTTDDTPWIEFADTLAFQTASTRASLIVAQAAITPAVVTTRTSLVVVQVAILKAGAVPGVAATGRSWGQVIG